MLESVPLLASVSALSFPAHPLCPLILINESVIFFFLRQKDIAVLMEALVVLWLFHRSFRVIMSSYPLMAACESVCVNIDRRIRWYNKNHSQYSC